mgnify:CR=1 FL=1
MKKKKDYFTLVELLVTIAVIAVLAGLLLLWVRPGKRLTV